MGCQISPTWVTAFPCGVDLALPAFATHCAAGEEGKKCSGLWQRKSILKSFVQTLMISASFRSYPFRCHCPCLHRAELGSSHMPYSVRMHNNPNFLTSYLPFPIHEIRVFPYCWTCNGLVIVAVACLCVCYLGLIKKLL